MSLREALKGILSKNSEDI